MNTICQNCGDVINKNFCGNCGHKNLVTRIDYKYAKNEFLSLIGFEKGFLHTSKELLIAPGRLIKTYLYESRIHITKPIAYIITTSLIYTIISHYLKTDIFYAENFKKAYGDSSFSGINNWIQENYGFSNLLMIFPTILWLKLFFRKYKYNFYEVFVVVSYIMGFGMLIITFQPILDYFFPSNFAINYIFIIFISFIYIGFGISNFYRKSFKSFIISTSAYILGIITFQIIIILVAKVYDHLITFI